MNNVVPEGWMEEAIGRFISDSVAGEWGKEPLGDKNDIPVLRATNFSESGTIDYTKLAFRNVDEKKIQKKSLRCGEIVLEKSGGSPTQPVGRVMYFDNAKPFLYSNFTQKLVPSEECDSKYLFYKLYFEYQNKTVLKFQQQTTGIINFQLNEYLLYKTVFPPLPEQQKIAKILTSVDEVIEKTQAQIGKLKDLKIGMMQELLTNGIGHTEFKDSSVGRIPVEWEVVKVSSVANVVDSMHQTPSFTELGKSMVRVTEIRNSEVLNIDSALNVDEKTFVSFSRNYQPAVGDILIARVGAYFGATAFVADNLEFCLGQNTASIRPEGIESKYLFIYLNSEVARSQMEDAVAVGAQPSLSLKAIKELRIGLPPLGEQEKISNAISSVSRKIELTKTKLDAIKKSKRALMQDLLTGKVRVRVEA